MCPIGTTNPVYVINARMVIVDGNNEDAKVRELAPKLRKTMDNDTVIENENSKKIKNAPGSLRRLDMKYSTRLKKMELQTLKGMSQRVDATASASGW